MPTEAVIARREAEQALLAAILVWPHIIGEVKAKLAPEDFRDAKFHQGQHARIFRAMCRCDRPDQVSVALNLNETNQLQSGDCEYLHELVAGIFGKAKQTVYWDANDYPEYIKVIRQYAGHQDTGLTGGWDWTVK